MNPDPFTPNPNRRRKPAEAKPSYRLPPHALEARLPPHALEAEQGVLGCLLLDTDKIGECAQKFQGRDVFYDLRHQTIFNTLVDMADANQPVDLITLQEQLKTGGALDQVGGLAYLSTLPDCVPSAANLSYYTEILYDKFLLRKTIATCTELVTEAYDAGTPVDQIMDRVERQFHKLSILGGATDLVPFKDIIRTSISHIEALHERKGSVSGLETGFPDLDRITDGLHNGEMFVLAARPSTGKTALAMNIAEHVATVKNQPVLIFSLEMTAENLGTRMIASMARVSLRTIAEGFLAERDFPKLTLAAGKLAKAPIHLDDSSALSILALRARARRYSKLYNPALIIIDYLQLMHSTSKKADQRHLEIADISSGIKALAKELNLPIIAISQLNRELEKAGRAPKLSDLRESGSIEQDADVVALLYRTDPDEDHAPAQAVDCLIAKQRNGPTGIVHFTFIKYYTRFESAAKVSEQDLPPQEVSKPYAD